MTARRLIGGLALVAAMVWVGAHVGRAKARTITIEDDFEYTANAGASVCTDILASSDWDVCDQTTIAGAADGCGLSTVTSIPGYTGSMPSGTRALRLHARALSAQTSCHLQYGTEVSPTGTIPADAWYQFAIYINYDSGSGETSDLTTRAWKMLYPCNGSYPCTTDYWLVQMGAFNYNPTNEDPNGTPSPGHAYLILRDNTEGTIDWDGAAPGDENKLGQTSYCDHVEPNTWKIVKFHINTDSTTASSAEAWMADMGGSFCKVMDWRGGTTVSGSAFTWTVPTARGHRSLAWPTTHPSNNTFGQETWVYYDDFTIATSESDLPTYGSGTPATPRIRLRGGRGLLAALQAPGELRF